MKHEIDLSKAFEKLDNGNPRGFQSESVCSTQTKGPNKKPDNKPSGKTSKGRGNKKPAPYPCPIKSCEGKSRMNWVDDCEISSAQEKKYLKYKLAAA